MLKKSKQLWHQSKLIRYAVGGGSAALIDLFFLWLFTHFFGIFYLISQICSFIISLTFGYYFQKYLTFRDFSQRHWKQASIFLLFQLIWLGINLIILKISVEYFGIYYLIGSIIAKGIVFIWNFIMNHYFNFTPETWK